MFQIKQMANKPYQMFNNLQLGIHRRDVFVQNWPMCLYKEYSRFYKCNAKPQTSLKFSYYQQNHLQNIRLRDMSCIENIQKSIKSKPDQT